jgi:RNA polymerase sigma-70 factor, ECF subfamily
MTAVPSLDAMYEGPEERPAAATPELDFEAVYEAHFAFAWRTLRRLGVMEVALDDAVQDVFVVVHRRLATFEGRASLRSWLFGIVVRVARDHRRSARRKASHGLLPAGTAADTDAVPDAAPNPLEVAVRAEAVHLLHEILDGLEEDKREVLVMADLEQMPVPEVAEVLGANVNTVYSRLRTARAEVEQAIARHRARDGWRQP